MSSAVVALTVEYRLEFIQNIWFGKITISQYTQFVQLRVLRWEFCPKSPRLQDDFSCETEAKQNECIKFTKNFTCMFQSAKVVLTRHSQPKVCVSIPLVTYLKNIKSVGGSDVRGKLSYQALDLYQDAKWWTWNGLRQPVGFVVASCVKMHWEQFKASESGCALLVYDVFKKTNNKNI